MISIASFIFLLVTTISTVEARKGDRRAAGYSKRGPASSGSFKKHKKRQKQKRKAYKKANRKVKDRRGERREDIKDYKKERREDVRDYKKERREDRYDYRSERRERRQDRRRVRRVVGAIALGAVAYNALKCRHEEVIVDGFAYSRCGNKWYEPVHRGGDVTYIVVEAPYGY